MPLLKVIDTGNAIVYLWKIEESVDELTTGINLREASSTRLSNMKSEVHKQGFLSIRQLLKVAGYSDSELLYDTNGKPYLTDNKCISISHSFQYATIIISNENVGIDIEMKREKIKRIAAKFCSSKELAVVEESDNDILALTTIWCAKEAMFKMCDSRSLSFKDHMYVDFRQSICEVNANVFNKQFSFESIDLCDFLLVYAFEK